MKTEGKHNGVGCHYIHSKNTENDDSRAKEKPTPLLSVVMPVYNPGKYFVPCLDSVLGQTFRDFELIAIDDCSMDDSYKVMQEYAARDERLIPLKNEMNSGAAKTRNRGLHFARGKYIVFLDADDYFEREYFEDAIRALEESGAEVVACPIYIRDERYGKERLSGYLPDKLITSVTQPFKPSDLADDILKRVSPAPYNKIIRREYLLRENIEFQDLSNTNDLYFGWISIAAAGKMVYLPKSYVHYRYETGNQISSIRYNKIKCVCDAYEKIYEEFKARDLWDTFKRDYHDNIIIILGFNFSKSDDPRDVIEYVRGEGGRRLDIVNLRKDDFSNNRAYGSYQAFMCNEMSLFGGYSVGLTTLFKCLFTGRFYGVYWLAGHYGKALLHGSDGRG